MDEDVHDFVERLPLVGGRIDDCVVQKEAFLLHLAIPVERVLLVWCVEIRIGPQCTRETRLVVGRSTHPAVRNPGPLGDGIATADKVVGATRDLEELMGETAVTGVGSSSNRRI